MTFREMGRSDLFVSPKEGSMSKSKKKRSAGKTAKRPMTFIVIQGVDKKLKAGWFAKAKRKEMTFSAWARKALGAAR